MGKLRRAPHLLEAFRAAEMGEGEQGLRPRPRPPMEADRPSAGAPAGPRQVTLGEFPCLIVRISARMVAVVVVGVLVLAVVAFVLGRVSGGAKKVAPAVASEQEPAAGAGAPTTESRRAALPEAVPPGPAPTTPSKPEVAQAAVFTVQVATYGAGKVGAAEELKSRLLSEGIPDVMVVRIGNQYRVCVGRFPTADNAVAKLALKRVRELSPDFRTAYINQLR